MYTKTKIYTNLDYWKQPEKPYPLVVNWRVVAPKGAQLSPLQQYDVLFDDQDCKIRQLTPPKKVIAIPKRESQNFG